MPDGLSRLGPIDFDAVRARNPLADYCESRGIHLRRSGGSLVGKCPLHNERNGDAFVVFDDDRWQCFGKCGKRGDVIDLERALGGGTLAEAAERLGAERRPDHCTAPDSDRDGGRLVRFAEVIQRHGRQSIKRGASIIQRRPFDGRNGG